MPRTSFFFSYATQDHKLAWRDNLGQRFNLIDAFFDHLSSVVAGRLGLAQTDVAFRDVSRLEVGDIWAETLTEELQCCDTLVALISPNYLKSENCGREFGFILDRFAALKERDRVTTNKHHILPVYWESPLDLKSEQTTTIRQVLQQIQFKTAGQMPENYPAKGLRQLMLLTTLAERERLCEALAERIVHHHRSAPMPKHTQPRPFPELPSAFVLKEAAEVSVGSGPKVAHIVYVIAEASEAEAANLPNFESYPSERAQWEPFRDAPGATVTQATQEGIRRVRDTEFINWNWPGNLMEAVLSARDKNSIVLFVLDRNTLTLPQYAKAIHDYSMTDLPNTCLVTVSGENVPETMIAAIFDVKYARRHAHHVWSLPSGRNQYVTSVESAVSGVKKELMNRGEPVAVYATSSLPLLSLARQG